METLCVPRPPPPPCAIAAAPALRCCAWRCRAGALGPHSAALDAAAAAALPVVGRRPSPARAWLARAARPARDRGLPEPPGAAARWARRYADNTELAALPAAADWPSLKRL